VSDDVDLCLQCFSVGTEINDVNKTDGVHPHRNDDPYRVMERLGEARARLAQPCVCPSPSCSRSLSPLLLRGQILTHTVRVRVR
jgi:hypothetical protein